MIRKRSFRLGFVLLLAPFLVAFLIHEATGAPPQVDKTPNQLPSALSALPVALVEYEGKEVNNNPGTWVFYGEQGRARWRNSSVIANLTVKRFDTNQVEISRSDPTGFKATYVGTKNGNRIEGMVTATMPNASNTFTYPWFAILSLTNDEQLSANRLIHDDPNRPVKSGPDSSESSSVITFASKASDQYIPAHLKDVAGVWDGELTNGNLILRYQVCLYKLNDTTYSGFEFAQADRNIDHTPIVTNNGEDKPHITKTLVGTLKDDRLDLQEIQTIGEGNWGLGPVKLRLVEDHGTPVIIRDEPAQPMMKAYLKRSSQTFPQDRLDIIVSDKTLQIARPLFRNAHGGDAMKYNDSGQLALSVKNTSQINLTNLVGRVTADEKENGIIDYEKLTGTFALTKGGEISIPLTLRTDFGVPQTNLHLNVIFSLGGIVINTTAIDVPTESFYLAAHVSAPPDSSARGRAIAAYFGLYNTTYEDCSKALAPIAASGDKMASMWESAFTSMGYGGYKLDEARGYTIGKANLPFVENQARHGDAEALYLLFYACQMGLEGEAAKISGESFLQKSAAAGYLPAIYDSSLLMNARRDYRPALAGLQKAYDLGVKRAAHVIGLMYEKGWGTEKDVTTAIKWYKKGIDFGAPEASLAMANLCSVGFEDNPPDIDKAMTFAKSAADKNCTSAMIFVGMVYFDGKHGLPQDLPTGVKWFKMGAERGDRQAMLALGETYLSGGTGVTIDEKSGFFWIKKAAELGSPKAMMILAKYYNESAAGDKNMIAARFWYNQAALAGYAKADQSGLHAGAESFSDFWKYADFSPSYVYVNEYGRQVGDAGDGFLNGMFSGIFGSMMSYYGNQRELIDGLEYIYKRNGAKIYGGTVSSHFISSLSLKQGQSVKISSYGIISTGMMSGPASADGLGGAWAEYRIIKDIPCSAVMAAVKGGKWQFIGQKRNYTAMNDGPFALAINAIDYRNYKGYFDIVVEVPED